MVLRPTHAWLPKLVCIVGVVMLALDCVGHMLTDIVPFAVDYSPRYYTSVTITGIAYVIAVWLFASRVSSRLRFAGLIATLALFVTGAEVYMLYHRDHPHRWVSGGWDGMERVTPYHEQLAVPLFVTLVTGSLIAIAAIMTQRKSLLQQSLGEREDVHQRRGELEVGQLAVREHR